MKCAIIDMGSNSIRMTVYKVTKYSFQILFKKKIMAGLASYVFKGKMSKEGADCAIATLESLLHTLKLLDINKVDVLATASLRNISNTKKVVDRIYKATGVKVNVLSGEEEAALGFSGALCDVKAEAGLFLDIGGASIEMTAFDGEKIGICDSIPIGSLRLYRDCVAGILPDKQTLRIISDIVEDKFAESVLSEIPPTEELVCIGGTARAVFRINNKLHKRPEEYNTMPRKEFDKLCSILSKCNQKSVDLILRYAPERTHTMLPGLMIMEHVVEHYNVQNITVSQFGLREGYLQEKIQAAL